MATTSYHDGALGKMRSRAVGEPAAGVPEIVLVQGMAVADYLLPSLTAWGEWTRAHLLELPGLSGSGDPPHELSVPKYGRAVGRMADRRNGDPVILAGHSSGTQVAAEAAAGHPGVAGLVLASPTVDPAARGLIRLLVRWQLNGRHEPPGLTESHKPEWKRAGARRLITWSRRSAPCPGRTVATARCAVARPARPRRPAQHSLSSPRFRGVKAGKLSPMDPATHHPRPGRSIRGSAGSPSRREPASTAPTRVIHPPRHDQLRRAADQPSLR